MFINISWKGKLAFEAQTESGHRILLDADPEVGGEDKGPRPMELLLVSLAGCTGMDVVSILKKKRVNLEGLAIKIQAERAPQHPKYFTTIDVEYTFRGKEIKEEDVKQAVELSKDKYCSVSAMLQEKATISFRWNIANQ
ncbi:MAG: OsmC family protein [candidate division Zixibacteria bacterium]|jgi:putative redox protein|nr:OsmC family protein [candidate division Zixibacteria bacterium]